MHCTVRPASLNLQHTYPGPRYSTCIYCFSHQLVSVLATPRVTSTSSYMPSLSNLSLLSSPPKYYSHTPRIIAFMSRKQKKLPLSQYKKTDRCPFLPLALPPKTKDHYVQLPPPFCAHETFFVTPDEAKEIRKPYPPTPFPGVVRMYIAAKKL